MSHPADPAQNALAAPVIYVVDDDNGLRESLQFFIRQAGYQVRAFENAESFLEHHDPRQHGCCILDHRMEGMGGLELAKILSELETCQPILFLTGYGTIPTAVEAMRLGAFNFIEKPVATDLLLKAIREALVEDSKRRATNAIQLNVEQRLQSLTDREREILAFIAEGMLTKQIASKLELSQKTVEVHRSRINRKLGFQSTVQMVRWLTEQDAIERLKKMAESRS